MTALERRIADKSMAAVKQMIAKKLTDLFKVCLDYMTCMWYHNSQCGICSVVYNAVEQVLLDMLSENANGKTPYAHIARVFDTDSAPDRLSKILLISISFMEVSETFVRSKTHSALQTIILYSLKRQGGNLWQALKQMTIVLKSSHPHQTGKARSPTVASPPSVDRKIVVPSVAAGTLNYICSHQNC